MEKKQEIFDWDDAYSIFSLIENEVPFKEYNEIEFKSAQGGFPKEFWKTYSAFANTNTGIIVLGITEKGKTIIVDGLDDEQIDTYKKQFWSDCNNLNTTNRNLLSNDDVKVIKVKGKQLLVFRVPYASRTERPVFLTRNPFGNTYKRNHEGDYRCTDDEIKRMLADSVAELKKDSLILMGYTLADLDAATLKQFRQLFMSSRPGHPWHALDDMELLKKIGAYRIDRKTKDEGITLAGMLMFGKADSLREQEALPNYFPDFRETLSLDPQIRWTDRIYPDGTWECNLLQFYLKVWQKLASILPKPFRLENDERVDETSTHTALREAFINTLVHADYSLSGNIIVWLDTEKFVFSNPGTLLVSLEQYYAGGISECRNPSLQQMFLLIGRAEKAGSGVDKIMVGWQESNWRKPFIELESQPDKVKLTLPMFSIIPDTVLDELRAIFGNIDTLAPDELTVLSFCQIEGSISNNRLQYILNRHRTDITSLLKKLCTEGYLESDNNGRWTTYKINAKVDTSNKKGDTSQSIDNVTDMKIKGDTSNNKGDTSKIKGDTSNNKGDTLTRLKKDELETQIMRVCKSNYVKMEVVAKQVNKSISYMKNKVFPQMIKDGKLEKHFPYTHNHPEQGYKTTDKYAIEL
ncbi:ATPase AAA [Bacteroidia bacterium]|nr:ATPase AAA [Bacteroidia bacterium]